MRRRLAVLAVSMLLVTACGNATATTPSTTPARQTVAAPDAIKKMEQLVAVHLHWENAQQTTCKQLKDELSQGTHSSFQQAADSYVRRWHSKAPTSFVMYTETLVELRTLILKDCFKL